VSGALLRGAALSALLFTAAAKPAAAAPADSLATADDTDAAVATSAPSPPRHRVLEPLVPEIAAHPYRLEPGVRPYRDRLAVSPGYGWFGTERLYTLRAAYNPEPWLGYEAAIGHNPGRSVHAVMHTLSAVVRRPLAGRIQPYLTGGYGMVIVFPGQAVNAAPVTKNALTAGGGVEWYLRGDLALRAELRHATVFGEQRDRQGIVAYQYSQGTVGLSFYRSIQP
jgi:hypothetical protein